MQYQGMFERVVPLKAPMRHRLVPAAVPALLRVLRRPGSMTIRASILLGFALMCVFTAMLGYSAAKMIEESASLVVETFDKSLMSINYARAASTDFAAMQAAFLRLRVTANPEHRRELEADLDGLAKNFHDDLAIAAQRSQSSRARLAAAAVNAAADGWQKSRADIDETLPFKDMMAKLDGYSQTVSHQIDLLINLTAGDGFLYRQQALRSIQTERRLDMILTFAALVMSGAVTWVLTRRISGPIAKASDIAARIARGDLDVVIPAGRRDELGDLLLSMASMRDSIRNMMQAEVTQRRSAQARLLDAVEGSQEGVVLVDRDGGIVTTNAPMTAFFSGLEGHLTSGSPFSALLRSLRRTRLVAESQNAVELLDWPLASDAPGTIEVGLTDFRWIRISWCMTRERGLIAFFSDVTLSRSREIQLQQTNLWFDAALSNMSQGLCVYDSDARLKVFNTRFCDIYDLPRDAMRVGMAFDEALAVIDTCHLAGTTAAVERKSIEALIAAKTEFTRKQFLRNGRVVSCSHRPISDGGWLLTYEDVTERQRSEAKIEFMARHDALTNLPNRVLFSERLGQALAARKNHREFSLLLIDLDRFKEVNDGHGHPVGDRLLRLVAERLLACSRQEDTVARLGGDEFAIIQRATGGEVEAVQLAERVIAHLSEPYSIDGSLLEIGASVGIAVAAGGVDADTLQREADIALYRVKEEGRGSHRVFTPSMDAALQDRRELEHDLHQALAERQMEMFYQPIIRISDGAVAGFEALVRWHHPVRGLLLPGEFIGIAEGTGFIDKLGAWILRNACRDAATWPAGLKVAINVSPVQFKSGQLVHHLRQTFLETGVSPSLVELEITETTLLHDNEATLDSLRAMHALGVTIALDDFGTGFSSLSYLRSFPFDRIKIDRSFVADFGLRDDASAIVRAVVSLGRSLAIPVTAEGVETREQFALLGAEGCDEAQGYLVSRPVSMAMIPGLLDGLSRGLPAHLDAA